MPRVLVIDDSPSVRRLLTTNLDGVQGIKVVGAASNAEEAQRLLGELRPDVLTLDMALPGMNGIDFLTWLTPRSNVPAIVLSAVTPADGRLALKALDLGAAAVISKPGPGRPMGEVMQDLIRAILDAGRSRIASPAVRPRPVLAASPQAPAVATAGLASPGTFKRHLIALGASTGGTRAIEVALQPLPAWTPGIVIVQHMPAGFTATFAERLNTVCQLQVREARDGDLVEQGVALVAPGGFHMSLVKSGRGYAVSVHDGERVHHQRPAVDVLFNSVARLAGPDAVGVLLTGMGSDGANGMKAMRMAGAHTIAEDESTCVVFGMPGAAIRAGAATEVAPLPKVPNAMLLAVAGRVPAGVVR